MLALLTMIHCQAQGPQNEWLQCEFWLRVKYCETLTRMARELVLRHLHISLVLYPQYFPLT